jgi:chemotaxis protein CheZ
VQQKVFRVEQMFGKPRAPHQDAPQQSRHDAERDASLRELAVVHDTIKRSEGELAALREGASLPRVQKELGAAILDMEDATQKILKSAESIDETARALSATVKNDYDRSLAQEVQEQVMRIYEASNFQDLAGQRIDKAIATLQLIEQQIGRLSAIWGAIDAHARAPQPTDGRLINGPKLHGDHGHAEQSDIDLLFG